MILKAFGYTIAIFKSKPYHSVGNACTSCKIVQFTNSEGEEYLVLADPDGKVLPKQRTLTITNNVNEASKATVEFYVDINLENKKPMPPAYIKTQDKL